MKWRTAVIVLLLAGMALGQTTKPATRPVVVLAAEDFDALKAEMEKLLDEVAKLRAENKSLKMRLAVPEDSQVPNDKIKQALARHEPEIGMTVEQWRSIPQKGRFLGAHAERVGVTTSGEEWAFRYTVAPINIPNAVGGGGSGNVSFNVLMRDGKVVAWRYGIPDR